MGMKSFSALPKWASPLTTGTLHDQMRNERLALSQTMYRRKKEANFKTASSSREATIHFAKSLAGGHERLAKMDGQVYAIGEAHKLRKALADGMAVAKNA